MVGGQPFTKQEASVALMKAQSHDRSSNVPIKIYTHANNRLKERAVDKPANAKEQHDNITIYRTINNRMVKVKPTSGSPTSSTDKKLHNAQQTIRETWKQSSHYCCKSTECSLCTDVCIRKRASMMLN